MRVECRGSARMSSAGCMDERKEWKGAENAAHRATTFALCILFIRGLMETITGLLSSPFRSFEEKPCVTAQRTKLNGFIMDRCPAWQAFSASPFAPGPLSQTIIGQALNTGSGSYQRREMVSAPDGVELLIDWKEQEDLPDDTPVILILHGIGGGSDSRIACQLSDAACKAGWRSAVYNRRGHGQSTLLPGPRAPLTPFNCRAKSEPGMVTTQLVKLKGSLSSRNLMTVAASVAATTSCAVKGLMSSLPWSQGPAVADVGREEQEEEEEEEREAEGSVCPTNTTPLLSPEKLQPALGNTQRGHMGGSPVVDDAEVRITVRVEEAVFAAPEPVRVLPGPVQAVWDDTPRADADRFTQAGVSGGWQVRASPSPEPGPAPPAGSLGAAAGYTSSHLPRARSVRRSTSMHVTGSLKRATSGNYLPPAAKLRCTESLKQVRKLFPRHSDTDDLGQVLEHLKEAYPAAPIIAVGFSQGSNALVHFLGEQDHNPPPFTAAISVSNAYDLVFAVSELSKDWVNSAVVTSNIKRVLLKELHAVRQLADAHGIKLDLGRAIGAVSMRDFDEALLVPAYGFESVEQYWDSQSSHKSLKDIHMPLLLVNSSDDPIIHDSMPLLAQEASRSNPWLMSLCTQRGGHLGWLQGWRGHAWLVDVMMQFMQAALDAREQGLMPTQPDAGSPTAV